MSDAKATIAARTWSPSSWRSLESLQMASYEAADAPEKIFDKLSKLPPLVQSTEVDALKELLAAAARGERFIVQGGDCAERFMDCETDRLWRQLGVLFQMGEIVSKSTGKGAVRIARIAGQYGKPRSKPTEVVEGHGEIMSFKGDNINGYPVEERKWDPKRLLEGYFHSAATLNYLRGVVSSGGLECLAELDVGHLASRADYADCQAVAKEVQSARGSGCARRAIRRNSLQAFFAIFRSPNSSHRSYEGIFTSHEAMQLDLEEALTRAVGPNHYNLSAHMVWIGDRTRQLLGGHVECAAPPELSHHRGTVAICLQRRARSPLLPFAPPQVLPRDLEPGGVQGGAVDEERRADRAGADPQPEQGGGEARADHAVRPRQDRRAAAGPHRGGQGVGRPRRLAVRRHARQHRHRPIGSAHFHPPARPAAAAPPPPEPPSSRLPQVGLKTRAFDDVMSECTKALAIHKAAGTTLAGVHLELTGQATVTECLGGSAKIDEAGLKVNYETYCDPRLNYSQAIEAAFTLANAIGAKAPAAKKAKK